MKTVIEMAREAGIRDCTCNGTLGCLERFAELVRADEREAICKLGEDSRYSHQYVHSFLNTIRARSNT